MFVKIHPKLLVKFAAHQGRACTDARPMEQLGSARHLWLRMQPSGATRAGAPASPTRTPKNASTEHPPLFSDLLPPRDTGPLEALRLCVQKSCTVLHMPHAGRNHQVSSQHREAASARKRQTGGGGGGETAARSELDIPQYSKNGGQTYV